MCCTVDSAERPQCASGSGTSGGGTLSLSFSAWRLRPPSCESCWRRRGSGRGHGALCAPFFGACPRPQAFIEPRPAPTVREVVLVQAPWTLSGGGLGPQPAQGLGRGSAGGSGPDQERSRRGRRARCSPNPRSEATSGLAQPGGPSWPGLTDLFILHTRCTRLAFDPVADEGGGPERLSGMSGSLPERWREGISTLGLWIPLLFAPCAWERRQQ